LLEPLSEKKWHTFCNKVSQIQNDTVSERKGVHPVVLEVVENVIATLPGGHYKKQYEQAVVDDERIAKKPDISIKMIDCTSKTMSSAVVPIEIKLKGETHIAIRQSMGYLMVKLRDQLEISQDCTSKLFGYCVGTDGYNICLNKIEIENYNNKILASEGEIIPFWTPDSGYDLFIYLFICLFIYLFIYLLTYLFITQAMTII